MITIVGLGAVGAVYANALHNANIPFNVAVNSSRLERYTRTKLIFNDTPLSLNYFTPSKSDNYSEYVLICTKSVDYDCAIELIKPIVGPNTKILPLLNGISSERIAAQTYNPKNVLYGYFIGHTAARTDRCITHDGTCTTVFGEKTNDTLNPSDSVAKLRDIFIKAGLNYRIEEDMTTAIWQKFIINIALNQTTAYFDKNYGEIKRSTDAIEFMQNLVAETLNIAKAEGISTAKMSDLAMKTLEIMQDEDCSSMLQDTRNNRRTEIDIFAGEIIRLAKKHNITTPYNSLILSKLY